MDTFELILTDIVLRRAIKLRKLENIEDLSIDPPNLESYVKQAVQQLKVWHPIVMAEIFQNPKK